MTERQPITGDVEDAETLPSSNLVSSFDAANRRHPVAAPVQSGPTDPLTMIDRAIQHRADPDTLAKLMDLQERHEQMLERRAKSEALAAYNVAIARAKAEIKPIRKGGHVDYKNKDGSKTDFRHGRLQDIEAAIGPVLSAHGLSYRFRTEQKDGGVLVTCILSHEAGHAEENSLHGAPDASGSKNPYQALGSAVTYLMRVTLVAALGLSFADDNENHMAGPQNEQAEPDPKIDSDQFIELRDLIEAAGISENVVMTAENISDLHEITVPLFEKLKRRLQLTIRDKKERANATGN